MQRKLVALMAILGLALGLGVWQHDWLFGWWQVRQLAAADDANREEAISRLLALHDPSERNSRRTNVLARPANQTESDVLVVRLAGFNPTFVEGRDQVDAAPRRLRLLTRLQVRRAVLQAQPAVHALRKVLRRRR